MPTLLFYEAQGQHQAFRWGVSEGNPAPAMGVLQRPEEQ